MKQKSMAVSSSDACGNVEWSFKAAKRRAILPITNSLAFIKSPDLLRSSPNGQGVIREASYHDKDQSSSCHEICLVFHKHGKQAYEIRKKTQLPIPLHSECSPFLSKKPLPHDE